MFVVAKTMERTTSVMRKHNDLEGDCMSKNFDEIVPLQSEKRGCDRETAVDDWNSAPRLAVSLPGKYE